MVSDSVRVEGDRRFTLSGKTLEYSFHVDDTGDLITDHVGGAVGAESNYTSDSLQGAQREFPDLGRGDYRSPAIHIKHQAGHTVTRFQYLKHRLFDGKEKLPGLPCTIGSPEHVRSLVVTLKDKLSGVEVDLSYSIFPNLDVVTRSFTLRNAGTTPVTIERTASVSLDMLSDSEPWDMTQLYGDWGRENQRCRREIVYGQQGFQSAIGYSSAFHNPFFAVSPQSTTESSGSVYGFHLIYSGSFSANIEKSSPGLTRIQLGLNPIHLSWDLQPGQAFTSPECVMVYEGVDGFGGMSRKLHNLYRHHLMRSKFALKDRPVLINHWEATEFDYDSKRLYSIAKAGAELGASLFVMDDAWFGTKHPRTSDKAGLGDWKPNPKRFPEGFDDFISRIHSLKPRDKNVGMQFGLWVEPEMVNEQSELYENHPDWALHAGDHERTTGRNQLILNLALPEVQTYLIDTLDHLFSTYNIQYVKWDKNRYMHELPSPSTAHKYMLGLYHIFETLITRHPDILFEGCSSGGGRFDAGILYYFPQSWTSDMTDGLERLSIQFGTSLTYPPSSMGCHVSHCPSGVIGRTTSICFRAHVAMMGGSFGLELDPGALTEEERAAVPSLIKVAERVNRYIIQGDMYRLALPEVSNWPAVQYILPSGDAIVLAFQVRNRAHILPPTVRFQGLDPKATYHCEEDGGSSCKVTGGALLSEGIRVAWKGDCDSRLFWINRVE